MKTYPQVEPARFPEVEPAAIASGAVERATFLELERARFREVERAVNDYVEKVIMDEGIPGTTITDASRIEGQSLLTGGHETMSARRVDANQAEIVADLRAIGAPVQHLHEVGDGCPDIAVAFHGNYLFEIKTEGGELTEKQVEWHARWKAAGGQVDVIRTSEEAFVIMGVGWEVDHAEEENHEGVDLDREPYGGRRHKEEEPDEDGGRNGARGRFF